MDQIDDVVIMESLDSDFTVLDQLLNVMDNKSNILKYEKLFLTEHEIFENNIMKYLTYINDKPDTKLWEYLVKELTNEEIIIHVNNFLDHLDNKKFSAHKIFMKILGSFDANILSVKQLDKIFKILVSEIDPNDWSNNVISSYTFLEMTNLLDAFVLWSHITENAYIKKINIDISDRYITEPSDLYITSIVGILLNAFTFSDSDEAIDPDYIMDKSCKIQWYTKKYNKKSYNTNTKLFYGILNGLRVGIAPVFYRYRTYGPEIEHLNLQISANQAQFLQMMLANKKKQLELYYNDAIQIVGFCELHSLITGFYS